MNLGNKQLPLQTFASFFESFGLMRGGVRAQSKRFRESLSLPERNVEERRIRYLHD